jgi:hypothetical protein
MLRVHLGQPVHDEVADLGRDPVVLVRTGLDPVGTQSVTTVAVPVSVAAARLGRTVPASGFGPSMPL